MWPGRSTDRAPGSFVRVPRRFVRRAGRLLGAVALAALALELGTGCGKKDSNEDPLVARGRALYSVNCTACHNSNPALPGTLGPDVKGSSLDLLTARILEGGYPPGYAPKRSTKVMQRLPLSISDVEALQAFLSAP